MAVCYKMKGIELNV